MGFLNEGSSDSVFLEVDTEQNKKRIRPLATKPQALWVHKVQAPEVAVNLSTGKPQLLRLRNFHKEVCVATNRRGTGCFLHSQVDPGWSYLSDRDQTNRNGQRVDFPVTRQLLLPVWSYADNAVRILDGGNQIYEAMDEWYDLGKNINDCDWLVWKIGTGKTTQYKSAREDATTFTVTVDTTQVQNSLKESMELRYTPLTLVELQKKIYCKSPEEARVQFESDNKQLDSGATAPKELAPAVPDAVKALQALYPTLSVDQLTALVKQLPSGAAKSEDNKPANFPQAPPVSPVAQEISQSEAKTESQQTVTKPSEYILQSGKYKGKNLEQVFTIDTKYVEYVRAQGTELEKKLARELLDSKPVTPILVSEMGNEQFRSKLVDECHNLIQNTPDFQGVGMSRNLIPYLKGFNSKQFDYHKWSVGELQQLRTSLHTKLGINPLNQVA